MQKIRTDDLRTRKTERLIRDSFHSLLAEKDFEEISIKELCEKAQINRKTFYAHYDSLEELRQDLINRLFSDTQQITNRQRPHDLRETITLIFDYLCDLPADIKIILSHSNYDFRKLIGDYFYQDTPGVVMHPATKDEAVENINLQ